ncbi:uncharacterized protein si:dkeyp-69c1.9 isoform X2 [Heterodontus francisci]|uniref:uncharacterized protein si:dkeyp-69c1.9 isoform X2 n=1 Tax=Heterodontus francisci TaxID=7792 RepID=UPI00355B0160
MALGDLRRLEELEFPEFSCLCELCDCGQHKQHQNCKKNQLNQRGTDCLLSHYQSTFTRPLNIQPRSSKRPFHTPLHCNPPAMQCETTQRSEFSQKARKDRPKGSNRSEFYGAVQEPVSCKPIYTNALTLKEGPTMVQKHPCSSVRSSRPSSNGSTSKAPTPGRCGETPATAGDHDLNTTYKVNFKHVPFGRQHTPAKKRAKAKSAPMEMISSYRADFPPYSRQPSRMRVIQPRWDNLRINPNLPAEFNTTQRESYIGWDPTQYPRPDLVTFRDEMSEAEGTIDTDTVTKGKIENQSITRQDYPPKNVCKSVDSVGQQNSSYTTMHSKASSPTPLPMCKLQAYLLHQRLKGMKICSRPAPVTTQ